MAAGYRAGFVRDSPVSPETYTVASTAGTGTVKHGFTRRTDDSSDALMVSTGVAGGWRCGFLRSSADPLAGALSAVQETTADMAAPLLSTYWRGGFLREVGTDRIVWQLAGIANANARMWNGFMRAARGDLILD